MREHLTAMQQLATRLWSPEAWWHPGGLEGFAVAEDGPFDLDMRRSASGVDGPPVAAGHHLRGARNDETSALVEASRGSRRERGRHPSPWGRRVPVPRAVYAKCGFEPRGRTRLYTR